MRFPRRSSYSLLSLVCRAVRDGVLLCCTLGALVSCHARATVPGDTRTCEQRRDELLGVLKSLPEHSLTTPIGTTLPTSPLSGAYHRGALLEIEKGRVSLNGKQLSGVTLGEIQEQLRLATTQLLTSSADTKGAQPRLNVAAAPNTDIRTLQAWLSVIPKELELEILFATPAFPAAPDSNEDRPEARVLTAPTPEARHAAARQGYEEYAECEGVTLAAGGADAKAAMERWPYLKNSMLHAIPTCECEDIDADSLRGLLVAEQRAGSVALGSIPGDFLRDIRCSASMPLRSVQQLLNDIDKFDAEFAGDWQTDALQFEQVVTSPRLLNYLCTAMPGETLEYLQRDAATLYWRAPAGASCQAWQFQPLSPGSPMGTWQRKGHASSSGARDLAFEYRMGGNEIRLFGPVNEDATPPAPAPPVTDQPETASEAPSDSYPCDQNVHMIEVTDAFISLKNGGKWFFTEAACKAAPASDAAFQGCVGKFAGQ